MAERRRTNASAKGSRATNSCEQRQSRASNSSEQQQSRTSSSSEQRRSRVANSGEQRRSRAANSGESRRAATGGNSNRSAREGSSQRAATTAAASKRIPKVALIVAAIVLLVVIVVAGRFCSAATTIDVTVNGAPLTIHGAKTMEVAVRESGLPINPGDLISLSGTTLKKSAGYPFYAKVNGEETADPAYKLHNGDNITVSDGKDMVEEYDVVEEAAPHDGGVMGLGAICAFEPGEDGVIEVRTGRLSGDVVRHTTEYPTDTECKRYNPDVGDDKVIVLTFDEGPTQEYTTQILDILKENDAKATFFCMGSRAESNPDLVQREREEGHQVCAASYDMSRSGYNSGQAGSLASTADELVDQLDRGRQALASALGSEQSGGITRLPVVELTGELAAAVDTRVTYDIGWNLDTGDWVEYNTDQVYEVLMQAESGDVILMHDGTGDRTNTVTALKQALPKLKEKGFSFITIDEFMSYPRPESS